MVRNVIFGIAMDRFGIMSESAVFIDNINAARTCGMSAHHFTNAEILRAELTALNLISA